MTLSTVNVNLHCAVSGHAVERGLHLMGLGEGATAGASMRMPLEDTLLPQT